MSLIRGPNGLAPCPICIVPKDQQHIIHWPETPMRNYEEVMRIVASHMTNAEKEALLQPLGCRPVFVSLIITSMSL